MLEYLHVVGTSPTVQITNRGFMGSKWLPHARTMIFWSRSYLCISFLETLWYFGRQFIESVYIFSLKPFGFGDAHYSKVLICIHIFPVTLRIILETPIHWNPLKALVNKGTLYSLKLWIPWTFFVPLKHLSPVHLILYTHQPPHTGSKLCYVRVPRGVGQRGGNPLSLESLEPFSLFPLSQLRPEMDFRPPWNIGAEIVLCWGTQRHGVSAWGVVRLNPDALEPLRLVKTFYLLDRWNLWRLMPLNPLTPSTPNTHRVDDP